MASTNDVNRAVVQMVGFIKDTVSQQVIKATSSGSVKLSKEDVQRLITILTNSIDGAYHQSAKGVETSLNKLVAETAKVTTKK